MNQELVFPKSFPKSLRIIAGHGNESRIKKYFERSIPQILEALEAGEILSTTLNDLRSDVNRIIDEVVKIAINEKYLYSGKYATLSEELHEFSWSLPGDARSLNAFIKRLNKLSPESKKHPMYEDASMVAMELFPFYQFIEWTKTHTIKASERKKEQAAAKASEKAEYIKKLVAHKDVKKVIDLLETTATDIKKELFEAQLAANLRAIRQFQASEVNGETDIAKIFERAPMGYFIVSRFVERTDQNYGRNAVKTYKLVHGWLKKLEEYSDKEAQSILDHFVMKNSSKMSVIMTQKNNLKSVEIKNVKLGAGVVECDVHCVFMDGSEFTANNKVVFSISKLGKGFFRYPTTFRNVILPTGAAMSRPSEERMDKVFAVAK